MFGYRVLVGTSLEGRLQYFCGHHIFLKGFTWLYQKFMRQGDVRCIYIVYSRPFLDMQLSKLLLHCKTVFVQFHFFLVLLHFAKKDHLIRENLCRILGSNIYYVAYTFFFAEITDQIIYLYHSSEIRVSCLMT